MVTIARFALFFLSLLGYFLYLYFYRKIAPPLLPAVTFAAITVVTVLSGILNTLLFTTWLLLLGGVVLLTVCIKKKIWGPGWRSAVKPIVTSYPLWFFLLCTAALAIAFNDSFLSDYDDFSHWGIAASTILTNDRFPNFSDPFIMFASYPLGAASFIYYCCRSIGTGDGMMLLAQSMATLGYLVSLFACVKRNKLWGYPLVSVAVVLLLSYNVSPFCLCVDTLLAAAGIACMVFLLEYGREYGTYWPWATLLLCAVVTIKNSGIFFACIGAGYALYSICSSGYAKRRKLLLALSLLTPLVIVLLWSRHVDMVFSTGLLSKHSMSVQYYLNNLAFNGAAGVRRAIEIALPRILNPLQDRAILLLVAFLLLAVFTRRFAPQMKRSCRELLVFAAAATLLYELGMLFMYCFSMQIDELEMSQADDYFRYNGTLILFLCGLLTYMLFDVCNAADLQKPGKRPYAVAAVLLVAAAFALSQNGAYHFVTEDREAAVSPNCVSLHRLVEAYDVPAGDSYVVLLNEPVKEEYHRFMTNYYLRPWRISLYYDRDEAEAAWTQGDDLYFLDLQAESLLER